MLILSRREGECIFVGDDICITVVEIRDSRHVRIGITAPKDVPIVRDDANDAEPRER